MIFAELFGNHKSTSGTLAAGAARVRLGLCRGPSILPQTELQDKLEAATYNDSRVATQALTVAATASATSSIPDGTIRHDLQAVLPHTAPVARYSSISVLPC